MITTKDLKLEPEEESSEDDDEICKLLAPDDTEFDNQKLFKPEDEDIQDQKVSIELFSLQSTN